MAELLIASGHRYEDVIGTYPLPLLESFAKIAIERRNRELLAQATAMRVASNGDAKDWEKFREELLNPVREAPADKMARQLRKLGVLNG